MLNNIFENPFVMIGLSIALYTLVAIAVGIYKNNKRDWGENE